MNELPVLAVGDCHGDLPVLQALLEQEGVLSRPRESIVIQLGDLGHFARGSQARDREIYLWAKAHLHYVLWGNHDYAAFNSSHVFNGYEPAFPETIDVMKLLVAQGRLRFAMEAHGYLLTHAGLHKSFTHQDVDEKLKQDPAAFAAWFKRCSEEVDPPDDYRFIRDAISSWRGGGAGAGGILWRDATEKLYGPFRQVFGHSQRDKVRLYPNESGVSYCVDIHSATNGKLAGIWLPDERVVNVQIETARWKPS